MNLSFFGSDFFNFNNPTEIIGSSNAEVLQNLSSGDAIINGNGGPDTIFGSIDPGQELFIVSIDDSLGTVIFADGSGVSSDRNALVLTGIDSGADITFDRAAADQISGLNISAAGIDFVDLSAEGIRLFGTSAADRLLGGLLPGSFINGGSGNDTLLAANYLESEDLVRGGLLYGGEGNDLIGSFIYDDTIYGGGGNDDIVIGFFPGLTNESSGNDLIYGEAGNDEFLANLNTESLGIQTTIYGGEGEDRFSLGATFPNEDILEAIQGPFSLGYFLYGDEGDDLFDIGFQTKAVIGGPGFDRIVKFEQTVTNYFINTGDSNSMVVEGVELIELDGIGFDLIFGPSNADTVMSGPGSDTIGDSEGNDHIDGGAGFSLDDPTFLGDWLTFETRTVGTSTNLTAGTFTDSFGFQNTVTNVENVYGGAGADLIIGDALANTIIGGNGADTIQGLAGADSIAGGLGADLLIVGAGDIVSDLDNDDLLRADGGDGSPLITGGVAGGTNVAIGGLTFLVEGLSLTADDFQQVGTDWQLRPAVLNPSLALPPAFPGGTVINQNVSDGASVMTITASDAAGNLEIRTIQPVGSNLIDVPTDPSGLTLLDLSAGLGAVTYGAQTAIAGSAAIDLLSGLGLSGQLSAADLALVSGGLKPDPVFDPPVLFRYVDVAGNPAANTLPSLEFTTTPGPEGTTQTGIIDLRDVGGVQASVSGFDQVVVLGPGTILDDIGDTFLQGDANGQIVRLSAGNDTLIGGAGDELAYGNQGNDILYGNQGGDRMFGGKDADILFGGRDADGLYGNLGNDAVYGNKGADALYGGQGDDLLFGGQDADLLFGGKGADRLVGGAGNDTMFGGGDADQFDLRFGQPGDVDVIFDYAQAEGDTILLRSTQPILSSTVSPDGDIGIQLGDRAVLVVGVTSLNDISFVVI